MKFNIAIIEKLERVIEVDADNLEDAIALVEEQYKKEEIILDYSDFDGNMIIKNKDWKWVAQKIHLNLMK